jgi:hypothetical protein
MKNVVFWDVALYRSCVTRRFGGTYRLHLQGRKIRKGGTSVSRWLQTEPRVGNNQLYKNRERGRVGHMGKSIERRGLGSVVKVIQAGSRGMCRRGKGISWGWGKIQFAPAGQR